MTDQGVVLFVYGTLLRGERYHSLLLDSPCLGVARTEPRYRLVDLGEYPALVAGGDVAVEGELYQVAGPVLDALDQLEGHPDHYRRTLVTLEGGADAVAYVMPADTARGRDIAGGDWRTR